MSVEENKALIRRIYDLWNRHETEAAYKLYAPDSIAHYKGMGDMSLDQEKQMETAFLTGFPDLNNTIDIMVAEDDKVAIRVTWRGTHKGEFMGMAPTGRQIEITPTAIFRIANSKLAETWSTPDMSYIQQLGMSKLLS